MKEVFEDEGWVDVGACECYEVHVEVAGVEEGAVFYAFDGCLSSCFFGGDDLFVVAIGGWVDGWMMVMGGMVWCYIIGSLVCGSNKKGCLHDDGRDECVIRNKYFHE